MKILTIQDISCYGGCSITVALPVLSALGIETAILPSALLSTHTSGFDNYTVLNLTDEMPKIIDHWRHERIEFDAIYTGYIGDKKQFDYIMDCKNYLLKDGGLFIVDPAMADNGKLYLGLNEDIIIGMMNLCAQADLIIPNITEASFITRMDYKEIQDDNYINEMLESLYHLGAKNIVLTGVQDDEYSVGAVGFDGFTKTSVIKQKEELSYHGTGDLFSSILIANMLNGVKLKENLDRSTDFIIDCICNTEDDPTHKYGTKWEPVLAKYVKKYFGEE